MMKRVIIFLLSLLFYITCFAGEADVVEVKVTQTGDHVYRFDVTVLHQDEGWKHYANKWDIVTSDGTLLGERILLHPHDNEQPFTRSLSSVRISDGIKTITIRVHDLVHGYGGKEMSIPVAEGVYSTK